MDSMTNSIKTRVSTGHSDFVCCGQCGQSIYKSADPVKIIIRRQGVTIGGFGSGAQRGQKAIRPIIEDYLGIDILDFYWHGLLTPGTVFRNVYSKHKRDITSVSIAVGPDTLTLEHKSNQKARQQEVQFTQTSCHYGGSRLCSRCGSKRNALYLDPEGLWACRHVLLALPIGHKD